MAANPRRLSWSNDPLWDLKRHIGVVLPILLGVAILVSGTEKVGAAPGFSVLMHWAPAWVWGWGAIACAVCSLCPRWDVRASSHVGLAVWMWLWWVAVAWGSFANNAVLTSVAVYFVLALGYTGSAVATLMDRGEDV